MGGSTKKHASIAMTDSVPLKKVREKVDVYDKALLAIDPRFRRDVTIHHEDGSSMQFHHAFLMLVDDWIVCFTEHFGVHIFHSTDLDSYWESERRYQAIEVLA